MFSFFSSKSKKDLSLILDIQSGLVRAALVDLSSGDNPHILYSVSKVLPYKDEVDGTYLSSVMIKAVRDVCDMVSSEGFLTVKSLGYRVGKLNTINYVMSSPWVVSQSKTVRIEYEKETLITSSLLKDIVHSHRNFLADKFKEGNLDKKYEEDLVFIEQKIFDVRFNGYPIEDYRNRKTRDLEISFAITTGSRYIMMQIEEAVLRSLDSKKHDFHSALLLQYSALRSVIGNIDEYVSLHVHSELTDFVVVKRGVSSYLSSFPMGATSIVRKVSAKLKNSQETTESTLSLYREGKLEDSECRKIEKILEPIMNDWQTQCLNCLGTVGERMLVPRLVYLSAHEHFDLFKKALANTKFEVFPFEHKLVDNMVVFEKNVKRSSLLGMYAIALRNMI